MSNTTNDIAPADFNLDDWIAGVRPTERSVQFTAAGPLMAQADDLLRRYQAVKDVKPGDLGVGDDTPDALLAQMEVLEAQLEASKTTWYVQALTPEQIDSARKKAESAVARSKRDPDYTAYVIAAAVTRIVAANGATVEKVTASQIHALVKKLGEGKVLDTLMTAIAVAMSEEPSITAPFSRTSSPDHSGQAPSPNSAQPETGESRTA